MINEVDLLLEIDSVLSESGYFTEELSKKVAADHLPRIIEVLYNTLDYELAMIIQETEDELHNGNL